MRLVWSETAVRHLTEIRDYIAEQNPGAAAEVARSLILSARRLREFPASGRAGRLPGTRELVVPGLPYIMPYMVEDNIVVIHAVLHEAREWPGKL